MTPEPSTATTAFPLFDRYQVMRKLGEGGMGTVYLALDGQLDRQVALKVLPAHSVNNPDSVGRFQREARALAKLSHPGIVQAFDCGAHAEQHFLVMEYVEGQSLAELLAAPSPLPLSPGGRGVRGEGGALSAARAADYIHQAALALQHAHEKGLIHRDLKPGNLLVTPRGQIKILDLGLARFLQDQIGDPSKTRDGVGMGTPDYAAPEQFRDAHSADPRADIYSLGCTLYHLLAGKVPFPGSSLQEKCDAHAHKEPPPLEEACPDVPIGLAVVVRKMMAKKPADRYQTAQDVANALTPFVGGSSLSFNHLKATSTWHAGQLKTTALQPQRRRPVLWALAGCAALMLLAVGAWLGPKILGPAPVVVAANGDKPDDKDKGKPAEAPKINEWIDPNVLTVSKDKKDGGTYRTIAEAITKVQRGQTIRVLDDAVYEEQLTFDERHAGVTLEAARGATVQTSDANSMIVLDGASNFTLRGFRLRAQGVVVREQGAYLVLVRGKCHNVLLEQLETDTDRKGCYVGVKISTDGVSQSNGPAVVVQHCSIQRAATGILFMADGAVGRTILRENLITNAANRGIALQGDLRNVLVVANRITDAGNIGIHLMNCPVTARNVLIANNTVLHGMLNCAIGNSEVQGEHIRFHNNLFLAPTAVDFTYVDEVPGQITPNDGKKILAACKVGHNWREIKTPQDSSVFARGWIPPATDDQRRDAIDGIERDMTDLNAFLRPAKDSPLGTAGAGIEEPSLPSYVGALPPEGVEPWDWDRTWLAWPGTTKLLTVTKDAKDGGTYRSINAALDKAKPWDTIRVLDDATYEEVIALTDKDKYEGVCLEAVHGAKLQMPENGQRLLFIRDVPHVQITGFSLTGKGRQGLGVVPLVSVSGDASGVKLSQLNLSPGTFAAAVLIQNVVADPLAQPLRVCNCRVTAADADSDGVIIAGTPGGKGTFGVQVANCRINGVFHGISVSGLVRDIQVVGNRIAQCYAVGLHTENLHADSSNVLFAANSVFGCGVGYLNKEAKPYPTHRIGQVEISNNLFAESRNCDLCYFLKIDEKSETHENGDAVLLQQTWRFRRNYRDCGGGVPATIMPLAKEDRHFDAADLASTAPDAPDRWRPKKGTALARDGAGGMDPSLPAYVGALPPEGVAPWDWDRTWRARVSKKPETGAVK